MKRWLRLLDPIRWPDNLALAAFLALALGPSLYLAFDLYVPFWLVIPLIGVLFWRSAGARWRDTATWTIPLGVAFWLRDQFVPAFLGLAIDLALYGLALAMIFVEPLRSRWLATVAPGVYPTLPGPDRKFDGKLRRLDDEFARVVERVRRDGDVASFRRHLTKIRAESERLQAPDAEWAHVHELWLHHLAWFDEVGPELLVTDEEVAEVNRRADEYVSAYGELRDRRSYGIGARASRETPK